MFNVGDKENNTSNQKQNPSTQFKIVKDPNYKGKNLVKDKPQTSSSNKNEILNLQKGMIKINAKVDKLDKKLDQILELLLTQKVRVPVKPIEQRVNLPSTTKKENLPKFSDVFILKTPASNTKMNTIEYPQLTSTPCNQIAFPATPIQQKFSPIPMAENVVNHTNSNEGFMTKQTRTNSLKKIMTKKRKLSKEAEQILNFNNEENVVNNEVVNDEKEGSVPNFNNEKEGVKETPEKELQKTQKAEITIPEYAPPACLINSRSRARKQKQSAAALKRLSPALLAPIYSQAEGEIQNQEEPKVEEQVQVPMNEPSVVNVDSEPVDVKPNCEPESSPKNVVKRKPIARVDFSLTNSFGDDHTADFLNIVASTKPIKMAIPTISKIDPNLKWPTPVSSKVPEQKEQSNDTMTKTLPSTTIEQPEIARKSISINGQNYQNEESEESFKISKNIKQKPKSQPLIRLKKLAIDKKKTLPPVRLCESPKIAYESGNLVIPKIESSRPKRQVAPKNLAEPKLNKKMRRNS